MAFRIQKIIGHVQAGFLTPQATAGAPVLGAIGEKHPDDIVIVSALRTPICRAKKGGFKDTYPDDLLKAALEGVVKEAGIKPELVGDVVVGNVQLDGAYAAPARMAQLRSGFPASVSLHTLNRQCSSGLQAVADVANAIKGGMIDIGIGAGVESMTHGGAVGGGKIPPLNLNAVMENQLAKDCLIPMGMTAENVASRWGITREQQDKMAVDSHAKALAAQAAGYFKNEIVPVPIEVDDKTVVIDADDGPRKTTLEGLQGLKTVFKKDGTVTAGTASQVSDGAAAVLLMSRAKATELGIKVLGVYRGSKVCGVDPDVMGIGPAEAIPLALEAAGLKMADVDIFEINEAFAAQAVFCVEKLGVPAEKLNPKGGAIALGHPLGATGARQVATLLHELKRTGKKTGVVSMCIGTGMGMAAVFEAE
jgi:acetyl-CoA acyltransferase 1